MKNTTFVKTYGESISFAKQVIINANATLISGRLSPEGNPYAGSTLSFSGTDANTSAEPGQIHLKNDSFIEIYDSMLISL